jgi:hypothetical protein
VDPPPSRFMASTAPGGRVTSGGTPRVLPAEDLLPQDVCVPAVLGEFAQYVEVHPAHDRLVKPDLLQEGGVLHQAQQGSPGRHQRPPRLLLGQPVQAPIEFTAVLVQERLELGTAR